MGTALLYPEILWQIVIIGGIQTKKRIQRISLSKQIAWYRSKIGLCYIVDIVNTFYQGSFLLKTSLPFCE